MKNPYQDMLANKFWKTAVSNVKKGAPFDNIWTPKFQISKNCKIITAGSCFAQHISRWLSKHDFNWIDSEPAPPTLPLTKQEENGYGVFSFRTGNIYTPAMLRQWVAQALGDRNKVDEVIFDGARYFDALRPQIPKKGYKTIDEVEEAREITFDSIHQVLKKADVFIFTLGLTEAWINTQGYVYPVCPGTIKGEFNSTKHKFTNFSFESLRDDMVWTIQKLRSINKNIKFLLTVSPVPLTATASNNHVLVASSYSKAVLRNVAGYLSDNFSSVDYFPSYELISSTATRSNFFEKNLRTVNKEGVKYVMQHFSNSIFNHKVPTQKDEAIPVTSYEVCEEIFLEKWAGRSESTDKICLLGDSHMGKLSTALTHIEMPHCGGMIMNGKGWTSNLIHIDNEEYFVPLENAEARLRWHDCLPFFKSIEKKVLISNIGMQTHQTVIQLIDFNQKNNVGKLNKQVFKQYFETYHKKKLSILRRFVENGFKVLVISDPPTRTIDPDVTKNIHLWKFYDKEALKIFYEAGCDVFNAEDHFGGAHFNESYYSSRIDNDGNLDWFHGSNKYYLELANVINDYANS